MVPFLMCELGRALLIKHGYSLIRKTEIDIQKQICFFHMKIIMFSRKKLNSMIEPLIST